MPGVMLATLCLNEAEWLEKLWLQHKDWPELCGWVFVEAADRAYAEVNPGMVSPEGLSVDGTTAWLERLAAEDGFGRNLVEHVKHGFCSNPDPAKGKVAARQRYMLAAEALRPEFVVVLDADEFVTKADQARMLEWMRLASACDAFIFRRRDIWHPPGAGDAPLFQWEARKGFWGIRCCHWWRWSPGCHYADCHNTPVRADGSPLNSKTAELDEVPGSPQMVHMGFAAQLKTRRAKNRYYAHRGEAVDRERSWYVESRDCFRTWMPGKPLPRGAEVVEYDGPVPECFQVN